MRFVRIAFALLTVVPQLPYSGPRSQNIEELSQKLHKPVQSYNLRDLNFVEALGRVASDFQIPMGIEWVDSAPSPAKIDVSWKHTTVEQILQAIVKTEVSYRMSFESGVVRISPVGLLPAEQNPLKLKIDKFDVQNVTVEIASRELHALAERTMSPPTPQQGAAGGIGRSGASNLDDPKISVRLTNSTVEDILDSIVLTSARKIWIVTFAGNASLTENGFRRTLTLWNDFPIPDKEQPLWDLLHWGDRPSRIAISAK